MKTIKDHLRDATTLAMDKREMEKHCGNALSEIIRLEGILDCVLAEFCSYRDYYTGEFADDRLRKLMLNKRNKLC